MLRILTTVFNGRDFLSRCLQTIRQQSVTDWKCYILDDVSTDDSYQAAIELTHGDRRFEIIRNTTKLHPPGNYQQVIRRAEIADEDIMIQVDGDDWLPDPQVFQRVLRAYRDPMYG